MTQNNQAGVTQRVLIVDDSEDMRDIFACLVQSAGAQPSTASSASEAIAKVITAQNEQVPFSLILLDIRMPEMNGNDAAREIKKAGFKGLLAACTAAVTGAGRKESLNSEIDFYFDKRSVKRETICALLEQAKQQQAVFVK